ncbi:unnamed protein product [Trichogramma brassicae]|uniref:Uncharacterized protein n=1 Tax=Trichogramma brassicae TaxID=86971 RepID=A0A6H5I4L9_9HYME|nr:unnamed protein product [Trichogramma brassicae]
MLTGRLGLWESRGCQKKHIQTYVVFAWVVTRQRARNIAESSSRAAAAAYISYEQGISPSLSLSLSRSAANWFLAKILSCAIDPAVCIYSSVLAGPGNYKSQSSSKCIMRCVHDRLESSNSADNTYQWRRWRRSYTSKKRQRQQKKKRLAVRAARNRPLCRCVALYAKIYIWIHIFCACMGLCMCLCERQPLRRTRINVCVYMEFKCIGGKIFVKTHHPVRTRYGSRYDDDDYGRQRRKREISLELASARRTLCTYAGPRRKRRVMVLRNFLPNSAENAKKKKTKRTKRRVAQDEVEEEEEKDDDEEEEARDTKRAPTNGASLVRATFSCIYSQRAGDTIRYTAETMPVVDEYIYTPQNFIRCNDGDDEDDDGLALLDRRQKMKRQKEAELYRDNTCTVHLRPLENQEAVSRLLLTFDPGSRTKQRETEDMPKPTCCGVLVWRCCTPIAIAFGAELVHLQPEDVSRSRRVSSRGQPSALGALHVESRARRPIGSLCSVQRFPKLMRAGNTTSIAASRDIVTMRRSCRCCCSSARIKFRSVQRACVCPITAFVPYMYTREKISPDWTRSSAYMYTIHVYMHTRVRTYEHCRSSSARTRGIPIYERLKQRQRLYTHSESRDPNLPPSSWRCCCCCGSSSSRANIYIAA